LDVSLTLLFSKFEQAAIDNDLAAIALLLSKQTDTTFSQAQDIYEEGSFSKSIAAITLDTGALSIILSGTVVTSTSDGSIVVGTVKDSVAQGTKAMSIQYQVLDNGGSTCNVGGNPTPVLDGCKFNSAAFVTICLPRGSPLIFYSFF
jgi:hypothetical protein